MPTRISPALRFVVDGGVIALPRVLIFERAEAQSLQRPWSGCSLLTAGIARRYYNVCYNGEEDSMFALKLTQIGNSVGVILPKEMLARLRVEKGNVIYLTESPDGYRITPHSEEFEAQMKAAREIMKERRAVLRELAK
jgi:putative addiction module antidote